ncbi:hypothetical protein RDWZM_009097 [Blomia tropicalis]|uniref:Uncharacterized protein n=1 Tax=Blomia tropicalis TaxID=40697 RepID=A0A9Q0M5X1_BLOTA|nr:hypothetical protein RDWZM_009097 [Blomia tropicalis]
MGPPVSIPTKTKPNFKLPVGSAFSIIAQNMGRQLKPLDSLQFSNKIADCKQIIDQHNQDALMKHQVIKLSDDKTDALKPKLFTTPVSKREKLAELRAPGTVPKDFKCELYSNIKYDPNFVTGIPMVKPKKTTKPVPFKFATSKLDEERRELGKPYFK